MLYKVTVIKYYTTEVTADNDNDAVLQALNEYRDNADHIMYDEIEYEVIE